MVRPPAAQDKTRQALACQHLPPRASGLGNLWRIQPDALLASLDLLAALGGSEAVLLYIPK